MVFLKTRAYDKISSLTKRIRGVGGALQQFTDITTESKELPIFILGNISKNIPTNDNN